MTRVFACSFAALLIAAIIAAPAPAQAERAEVPDKAGDVFSPEGANGWTAEGSRPNTDLRRVLVRHETRRVFVKAKYANLKKDIADEITFHAYLRTDDRTLFHVLVHIDPHGLEDSYYLSRYATSTTVECEGIRGETRFGANTTMLTVPRRCLGNPKWVRFQGKAESYLEVDGLFVDAAGWPGPKRQYATARPWTNRLERG